jgi:ATP-dependent DNA helicase RecQ
MTAIQSSDPLKVLEQHFGFSNFRQGQLDVILKLLQGNSVLSVFPTGGGKSLCYQLPALMLDGLTVVVSPLIALMKDQIDQLKERGICAVRLDSSLSLDEYRTAMEQIRSGEAKLLYVAPERFFNERFRSSLDGVRISLFAIDEAHCISQWGHNFRPDYLKLSLLAEKLNVGRVLALTATATPAVQQDIRDAFSIAKEDCICTEFYRKNLHLRSQVVASENRTSILVDRIKELPKGATIVYVSQQKTAMQIAEVCRNAGLDARPYHAGMSPEDRTEVQEWFMGGSSSIVVATIAFGMGIDKSDIRYVYHFNPPKSIENYAQEIGRAGRDGDESRCEMLLVPDDRIVLENFVYGDTPSGSALSKFIALIHDQPNEFFISQIKLGNECDIKSLVVKTLLTQLELKGYLESTSPRYDSYSFKPNVPSSEIINCFEGERQTFARQLLACSEKRKIWFHLDLASAIEKLGCERSRAVKALDYFAEKGWIELRATGLVHGYRKLKAIESVADLAAEFEQASIERENAEINRIGQVLHLATATECQSARLSTHFGQPMNEACGTCSFCIGEGPYSLPEVSKAGVGDEIIEKAKKLIESNPQVLNNPRTVARVLCGLTSPALTKARLSKHADFGICSEVSFGIVMDEMKTLFQ